MWELVRDFISQASFWQLVSIPFISAIVGWGTNWLALRMTFYPLHYLGFRPIGWQGIIPAKAGTMAGKAVDLLTQNLLSIEERFSEIDPQRVAAEMEPAFRNISEEIVEEALIESVPAFWETVPEQVKKRIFSKVAQDLPGVIEELMRDIKRHIRDLFDLRAMVVEALESDRALLNRIFLEAGKKEFQFIIRSGFYFGFLFGLLQMAIFYYYPQAWILPLAGLLVGWATNVVALRLIFSPLKLRKMGPIRVQGLFLKRQMEVSAAYAHLIASRILTSENIFARMLSGPMQTRLHALITHHVQRGIDDLAGISGPIFQLSKGKASYTKFKHKIASGFIKELPHSIHLLFAYAEEALDIERTIRTRMQALPARDFVGFLRPVFQEDEWKLILVGAILGAVAGLLQWIFIFGVGIV